MEYARSVVFASLTMDETARRAGSWAWAERYLYEVIGGWVLSTETAAVKVYFDSASQHHVWRASCGGSGCRLAWPAGPPAPLPGSPTATSCALRRRRPRSP